MEDVQWSQRLLGQFVFLQHTLSFLPDFSAASQDLGWRVPVCTTAEPLTYRFTTHLSASFSDSVNCIVFLAAAWHYSQLLKQAKVKLISRSTCKSKSYYGDLITQTMFCAGSPDWSTDACKVSRETQWIKMCSCVKRWKCNNLEREKKKPLVGHSKCFQFCFRYSQENRHAKQKLREVVLQHTDNATCYNFRSGRRTLPF